jgi:hypothetical protein
MVMILRQSNSSPNGKPNFTKTKNGETVYIKRTVHKGFVLAGQTVNSAYYCDILHWLHENVRGLHPKLWQQRTGHCITTMDHLTLLLSPGYFLI